MFWPPSGFNFQFSCQSLKKNKEEKRMKWHQFSKCAPNHLELRSVRYLKDECERERERKREIGASELNQSFRQFVWIQRQDESVCQSGKSKENYHQVQMKMCVSLQSVVRFFIFFLFSVVLFIFYFFFNIGRSIWRVQCILYQKPLDTQHASHISHRIQKNAKWNFNDADDRFFE